MPRDYEAATPEQIAQAFAYDPETGRITRLASKRTDRIGPTPEIVTGNGYVVVYAYGRLFRAHRIAWVLMTGEWPEADVDHINRDRADNRWANLRAATRAQNLRNASVKVNSATGIKGVARKGERFLAYIRQDGKKRHLGSFGTADEARAAYMAAASSASGQFASDGALAALQAPTP